MLIAMCKRNCRPRFSLRTLTTLGLVLLFAGFACSPPVETVPETESRTYRRGKSLQREGRGQEALLAFLQVIDERRIAPESHLEAGLIHLNHLRDPLSAIYHFNRYLQFKGDGQQAETVRELIMTAQKDFLRRLPGEPFADEVQRLDLVTRFDQVQRENENLRGEIVTLRRELERVRGRAGELEEAVDAARARAAEAGVVAPIVVAAPSPDRPAQQTQGPRRYVVQAGDTLSSISRTVYGTPGRWSEIYEANRNLLPSPNALRVGQELRIP